MPKVTRSPPIGVQHTHSDSDVPNIAPNVSSTLFKTHRQKRQRESSEEKLSDFKDEIKIMLDEWKESQNSLLNKLISEVASIKNQNSEIKKANEEIQKSLAFLNSQYEDMNIKIQAFERERKQHLLQIASLEMKMEAIERNTKLSTVEFRNIPKSNGTETKNILYNIVQNTCKALQVNIGQTEIRDVYRINNKSGNGTIIAELTSVLQKNNIIQGIKSHRKANPNQTLTSTHIGIPGAPSAIYISESLTERGRRLFYLARDLAKTQGYKFCWTSYGRIYLRKDANAPHIEIRDEAQLNSLKNQI